MYNHYIPQSDGSYRRSTMPEGSRRPQTRPQQTNPQSRQAPPPPAQDPPPPEPPHCTEPAAPPAPPPQYRSEGILSFLRGLLPRDADSTDLLVILILLLMNRDDDPDSISPMLTIALYFLL